MINSKNELCSYIEQDKKAYGGNNHLFIKWLSRSDEYYSRAFMVILRHYEYYLNQRRNIWNFLPYMWYLWQYRRFKNISDLYIFPNTVGPGFYPVHKGFVRIARFAHIGKNCTVLPMVLLGKKMPDIDNPDIFIGDNCYISTGVTILGPVKIGNNVTIGAGAVVTKDIPDNAVVTGVPAKIIKIKE